MRLIDDVLSIVNGVIPIVVVVFLVMTHGNYVSKDEYKTINDQIFKRLDNVEALIYKLLNEPTHK